MIRALLLVVGPAHRTELVRATVLDTAAAIAQGAAFALLVPVLRALLGPRPDTVWAPLGWLVGVAAVWAVLSYLGLRAGMESGATLSRALRHHIGDHVAAISSGWFVEARLGQLAALVGEAVMTVAGAPAHLLRPLVTGFVTPAAVVLVMYFLDWRLALATTLCAPVIGLAYRWSARLTGRADRLRHRVTAEAGGRVIEFAHAQPVLRAFGGAERGHRVLDRALVVQRDASASVLRAMIPGLIGFSLAIQAAFTVVMVFGTDLALGGSLSTADLVALLVLAARFVEPMADAAALGSLLTRTRNALDRIQRLLEVPSLPEPERPVHPRGTDIELDGVVFGYPDDPDDPDGPDGPARAERTRVLDGVSFAVPQHSTTALVGPSGSGKTTITRLIARFFDVDAGTVRIGGVDVRSMASAELMSLITTVFQDVVLFEGSILDNIRMGRPEAEEAHAREAARIARVDEIVARLPRGWDTPVGAGGTSLSGGERQRISIARAILKDAPIVLLDEPTAALDAETEAAVRAGLAALTAERTVLVIAHHLDTIAAADQILVLENGRVTQRGTHEQLRATLGRYASFWAERTQARTWRLDRRPEAGPGGG